MASVNNEASNTRKMREHQKKRLARRSQASTNEETDLMMCSAVINLGNSVALNQDVKYADLVQIMMANPKNLALVSDVDHQLLLKISFKDPVTLTSAGFRAETPPSDPEESSETPEGPAAPETRKDGTRERSKYSGPKRIKCYANMEEMDFVDTESTNPAQEVILTPEQLASGERIGLRGNRFSRCLSVQFFIEENQEDTDFTFLNRLCLWGRISPAYHLDF